MPRLIDADKLIELCNIMADKCDGIGKSIWEQFATTVEWSPTVDAVPLEDYKSMEQTVNKLTEAIADAEPVRHGHWVKNDNGTYSCSGCHSWIPNEQYYYARYCLFCGAKMDEVEEDDYEEPEINPCRGCEDYDGKGGCLSYGGCGEGGEDAETN